MKDWLQSINLQLFGDGGENASDGSEQTENENVNNESQEENKPQENEPEKKYTDGDVDNIVKRKIAEERAKAEEAVKEAEKLAKMNEAQKKDYEIEKMTRQLEEYKAKETKNAMISIARGMLSEDNIHLDDNLVSFIVTDKAESTKENVDTFKKAFNEAVEKAVTDKLRGQTPTVSENVPTGSAKSLSEMTYAEQVELQKNNPALFKQKISEM